MSAEGVTGRRDPRRVRASRGFALARVLITVAIIAIAGTVALPISRDHLDTNHGTQAVADLGAIEIAIARYKAANRGALPVNLSQLQLGVWKDPWGNPYHYVNLESADGLERRSDFNSNPLNRDYDLYSVGRDGRTASSLASPLTRDDVFRGLSGSFFGNASEYPGR